MKKDYKIPNVIHKFNTSECIFLLAPTSVSAVVSITGFGLLTIPKSAGVTGIFALSGELFQEIVMNKNEK